MSDKLIVKELGRRDYESVWKDMQMFTSNRKSDAIDELWFVEHPPVFTLGVGGKEKHLLDPHDIPVIRSNRGGQVTYHAPGQIVAYTLFDIRRKNIGIRALVSLLEEVIIELLGRFDIQANAKPDAPGVYVEGAKVAALGLRVSRGCSYHGMALNVDLDLTPFEWINPCGYEGLRVTHLREMGIDESVDQLKQRITTILASKACYTLDAQM